MLHPPVHATNSGTSDIWLVIWFVCQLSIQVTHRGLLSNVGDLKGRGGLILPILSINEPTILISRTTGTRSDTIMILQRGIQTWIDVVVASFHVRRRLAQVFFNKQTKEVE